MKAVAILLTAVVFVTTSIAERPTVQPPPLFNPAGNTSFPVPTLASQRTDLGRSMRHQVKPAAPEPLDRSKIRLAGGEDTGTFITPAQFTQNSRFPNRPIDGLLDPRGVRGDKDPTAAHSGGLTAIPPAGSNSKPDANRFGSQEPDFGRSLNHRRGEPAKNNGIGRSIYDNEPTPAQLDQNGEDHNKRNSSFFDKDSSFGGSAPAQHVQLPNTESLKRRPSETFVPASASSKSYGAATDGTDFGQEKPPQTTGSYPPPNLSGQNYTPVATNSPPQLPHVTQSNSFPPTAASQPPVTGPMLPAAQTAAQYSAQYANQFPTQQSMNPSATMTPRPQVAPPQQRDAFQTSVAQADSTPKFKPAGQSPFPSTTGPAAGPSGSNTGTTPSPIITPDANGGFHQPNSYSDLDANLRRDGGSYFMTLLALFASVGLNLYLGWIAWDTYNRYQDLVADMRRTPGPRRERPDRRLAESAAY